MERRHGTYLGRPRSPDRQSLMEALHALDNHNLELSMENAYLVEQMIDQLETHAEWRDELKKKIAYTKKKLKTCKDQTKEIQDKREGLLSLLKRCYALVLEIIEMQDFQMKELKNTEVASQDQPEGVGSEGNTQTDVALQEIQNDLIIKLNQLKEKVIEKNKIISNLTGETKAHKDELFFICAKLNFRQVELDQSIKKCNTLEQEFKMELAKREESWEMRQNDMERLWLEREGVLKERVSKAEEELNQVVIKNIKLKELVLEKKKKGFWAKMRQGEKSQKDEEAAAGSDQPDQEERKAEEKPKKQGIWNRGHKNKEMRAQRSKREEEGAACPETEEQ